VERIAALPDAEERADALVGAVRRLGTRDDRAFRTMLGAALDPAAHTAEGVPTRQANRVGWIEAALGRSRRAGRRSGGVWSRRWRC
jgi:hypothetical protein